MSFIIKVAKWAAKYGSKAVKWVWDHKWEVLALGEAIYDVIKDLFG